MPSALNTGVPLAGGIVNSPGTERQSENLIFGPLSTSLMSHKIFVTESPILLKAFGLENANIIYVNMVSEQPGGDVIEKMVINEGAVALTYNRNTLVLDMPGVYRLQCLNSGYLGNFVVTAQQTAMSYWSWGLAAFGNALSQNNPIPPP